MRSTRASASSPLSEAQDLPVPPAPRSPRCYSRSSPGLCLPPAGVPVPLRSYPRGRKDREQHCPSQLFTPVSVGLSLPLRSVQGSRGDSDGDSCFGRPLAPLLSAPAHPSPVLPIWPGGWGQEGSEPQQLHSGTTSKAGAARLFLHLPGQLCMAMRGEGQCCAVCRHVSGLLDTGPRFLLAGLSLRRTFVSLRGRLGPPSPSLPLTGNRVCGHPRPRQEQVSLELLKPRVIHSRPFSV